MSKPDECPVGHTPCQIPQCAIDADCILRRRGSVIKILERDAREAHAARIAAQTENEKLKSKLAAAGVAQRRAVHAAVMAEREACAKVCDAEAARAQFNWRSDVPSNQPFWNGAEQVVSGCAEAIRARGAA